MTAYLHDIQHKDKFLSFSHKGILGAGSQVNKASDIWGMQEPISVASSWELIGNSFLAQACGWEQESACSSHRHCVALYTVLSLSIL